MTDPADAPPDNLPAPLRKPILTQKQFRAIADRVEAQMLRRPWHLVLRFYYLRKGELAADDGDVQCYACALTLPQYHRCEVRVMPDHPNWTEERSVEECLRHEVAHSFWSHVTDLLAELVPAETWNDPRFQTLLAAAEDTGVDRVATMPVFDEPSNETPGGV